MPQYRSAEEALHILFPPRPMAPMCVGVLAFLGHPRVTWGRLDEELEEAVASAMTHLYDCASCTYRLAGLRHLN